jgi:Flp pilus assembly protein TadD
VVVAPIIRICKRLSLIGLLLCSASASAAPELGDLYWEAQRLDLAGRGDAALKSYARLLVRSPNSEAAANNLLAAAVREGSYVDALSAIRTAQKAQLTDSDAPLLLFIDAFRRKKWAEAEQAVDDLEAKRDFAFMAPMLKSWLNVAQGRDSQFSSAQLLAGGLTAYYGDDQLVYFDLADGNIEQAKLRLRNFRGYNEPHGRFLAGHAMGEFARQNDQEFASALGRQIGLEQGNYTTPKVGAEIGLALLFARLSIALDEQKQPQNALYFGRLAQWIAPASDAAKLSLAELLQRQGLGSKSEELLNTVAPSSPFWFQSVVNRTQLAANPEASALIARNALSLQPGSSQLKLLYAQTLEQAGQRSQAITVYRDLVAQPTADMSGSVKAMHHLLLASALDAEGDWNGARTALETALTLDPKNAQILNYLGYSLLERRIDVPRGFELVSKAHELAPQSAAITDSLGWAYFLKGDVDTAIPLLERAVAAAIADAAINEHLGDAYWAAGRRSEARFAWKAAALAAEDKTGVRLAQKIDFGWTKETAAP